LHTVSPGSAIVLSIGINSVIFSRVSQIACVMSALKTMEQSGVQRIEVRPEALQGRTHRSDPTPYILESSTAA